MCYVNLVLMVVPMMTVVAIVAVSVGPVVRRPTVVAVVRIRPVVAIWIITGWITISVTRINPDSDSSNAYRYLSVRTLDGHKK